MFCRVCSVQLNKDNWLISRKNRGALICKHCENKQNLHRYSRNKEKYLESYREAYQDLKRKVFEWYGNGCDICGETNAEVLSLDHIDGSGRKHRKEILGIDSGTAFYKWVGKNKPNNLRILCYNCNCRIDMQKKPLSAVCSDNCKYCGEQVYRGRACSACYQINKRNNYIDLKLSIFEHYGNCCCGCGEHNAEYLTIDHINNNGSEHRKEIRTQIYPWLKRNNYPAEYQILCFNCNYLKQFDIL